MSDPETVAAGRELTMQLLEEIRQFQSTLPTNRGMVPRSSAFCERLLTILCGSGESGPFPLQVWDALKSKASEIDSQRMGLWRWEEELRNRAFRLEQKERSDYLRDLGAIVDEMLDGPDATLRYRVEVLRELLRQKSRPLSLASYQILATSASIPARGEA